MPHYRIYSLRIENFPLNMFLHGNGFQATLSNFFFEFSIFIYWQTVRIKYAKILGSPLSRYNIAHVACRTYEIFNMWKFFLSDRSIVRQMLDKWDVEQMKQCATDMEPVLILGYEETFAFSFVYEYSSIAVRVIKHMSFFPTNVFIVNGTINIKT